MGYEQYNGIKNTPIYVQCWANVMRNGDVIKAHRHMIDNISPNDALSGHLCVKVDGSTNTYYARTPIQNKIEEAQKGKEASLGPTYEIETMGPRSWRTPVLMFST